VVYGCYFRAGFFSVFSYSPAPAALQPGTPSGSRRFSFHFYPVVGPPVGGLTAFQAGLRLGRATGASSRGFAV